MHTTIIGSGNVATHLAAAFKNAGHRIVQVYSRNMQNAALLAYHVKAEPIDDITNIDPNTDLFVIAIKDDAIGLIAEQLASYKKLMVHTSGATDLYTLLAFSDNVGVFYPLQTFSKTKEVDFRNVPLCIEAADENIAKQLTALAQTISNKVYLIDSAQRKILHLAAVFACNFPNYLYTIAQQILAQHQLDFELLRPLILETAQKVQVGLPATMQTGPAARNDGITMNNHLQLLKDTPHLQELYTLLSQDIIKLDKGSHGDK
ncbi:Rossmann-like and DUF2520 domain-containing protein [Mucilaginibacter sp.]|uniref:Rossmann-like and DUF2520 domain-containing protein n=1 Tax=Mucilaginibacter sp. TaxID=1882438 RepID=UPI0026151B8E|nr:Rossmann-like and DUF2520 domain-containing protein [Mucilaginibacter sp.]MDB5031231.1 hypothetical protein [Mucilaginibacter sp.]